MKDQTYKVRKGDKLSLHLPPGKKITRVEDSAQKRGGAFNVDDEDEVWVFRKKGLQLYDIGMVFNNDTEEYEEIRDHVESRLDPISLQPNVQKSTFDAFYTTLLAKYLDGLFDDPVKKRKPIKFEAQDWWIDVIQTDGADTEHKTVIGEDEVRPLLAASFAPGGDTAPNDSNEGWTKKGDEGILKLVSGIEHFRVESFGYFLDFDTEDTARFKITEEPTFESTEVTIEGLSTLEKVYLVPLVAANILSYRLEYNSGAGINYLLWGSQAARRISPYQDYDISLVAIQNGGVYPNVSGATQSALKQQIIDNGSYDYATSTDDERLSPVPGATFIRDYFGTMAFVHDAQLFVDGVDPVFLAAAKLRAVLKTKSKVYYIWLKDGQTLYYPNDSAAIVIAGFGHGIIEAGSGSTLP